MMGQTVTGCYNMATHQLSNVTKDVPMHMHFGYRQLTYRPPQRQRRYTICFVAHLTRGRACVHAPGGWAVHGLRPYGPGLADVGIDLAALDNEDGKAALTDILTYHVYAGAVQSSAVTDGMTVTMVNGDDATFTVTDGTVKIGDATVTLADVIASNGVIHVIDKVLTPPVNEPTLPVGCDYLVGIGRYRLRI